MEIDQPIGAKRGIGLQGDGAGELVELRENIAVCWVKVGDGKVKMELPASVFLTNSIEPGSLFTFKDGNLAEVVSPSERQKRREATAREMDRLDEEFAKLDPIEED